MYITAKLTKLLPQLTLKNGSSGLVTDAQLMMHYTYQYWMYEGYWNALSRRIADVINSLALFAALFVGLFCLQWHKILHCEYLGCATELLGPPSFDDAPIGGITAIVVLLGSGCAVLLELRNAISAAALLYEIHRIVATFADAGYLSPFHKVYTFARPAKVLPREEGMPLMEDMGWSEFLRLFCRTVRDEKLLRNSQHFDERCAMEWLMLYDNVHIALHDAPGAGVLTRGPLAYLDADLLQTIVRQQFNSYYTLESPDLKEDETRQLIRMVCVGSLLLYPMYVSFHFCKMVVKSVSSIKANPLGQLSYEWRDDAHYRLRLYNEAKHIADARLNGALSAGVGIISKAYVPFGFEKLVQRLTEIVIVMTLLIGFINPSTMNASTLGGYSLLFWLTTALVVYNIVHREPVAREYQHVEDVTALSEKYLYAPPPREWIVSVRSFAHAFTSTYIERRGAQGVKKFATVAVAPLVFLWLHFDPSLRALLDALARCIACLPASIADDDGAGGSDASDAAMGESGEEKVKGGGDEKVERSLAAFAGVYTEWAKGFAAHGGALAERIGAAARDVPSNADAVERQRSSLHASQVSALEGSE